MIDIFKEERAAALILVFVILVTLSGLVFTFLVMTTYEIKSAGAGLRNMQAFYIADAGRAKARWALAVDGQDASWRQDNTEFAAGTYTVYITDNGDGTHTITAEGYIPNQTNPIIQRRVIERNIPLIVTSGANLSLTAAATASSEQGGNTADKSNDGNSTSRWRSPLNNGSWLKHDFGSSSAFDQIVYDGKNIDTYDIEYSSDDISYSSVTNPVESPAGTVTFDLVSARYLRFDLNGNSPEVNELETYDTATETTTFGQGLFVTSW